MFIHISAVQKADRFRRLPLMADFVVKVVGWLGEDWD